MRPFLFAVVALFALAGPCLAQSQTDVLARCLGDNTTGKDRKDLARWIFMAIATHPEMKDVSTASADEADRASRTMGTIVNRLLTESCRAEVQAAMRADGSQALGRAFETLGRLAMAELMTNKDVAASLGKFERYVDRARINALLEGR